MSTYLFNMKKSIGLFGIFALLISMISFVSIDQVEAAKICSPTVTTNCIPAGDVTDPQIEEGYGDGVTGGSNIGDIFWGEDQNKNGKLDAGEDLNGDKEISQTHRVVAYGGWLTPSYIVKNTCPKEEDTKSNYTAEPSESMKNASENRDWITKILGPPLKWIAGQAVQILFKPDCNRNVLSLSVTTDIAKIGQSVNVVNNPVIMKLTGIMQWLAYGLALLYIMFYSLMYMIGQQQINPYKFAIRLFFASVMVWYAPYIAQDILNLNNVLVHTLSGLQFTFNGATSASSTDISWAIYSYIDAMVNQLGENILLGIISIFMVFYLIGPLINLLLWWYGRLLKILFYTIISPIMMMMMALPQTARMASTWFRNFIGEVFSQAFVVMGMVLISLILVNLNDMDKLIGLGFIGKALLVFAALTFMSGLPSMASAFIGSIGGSTPSSGDLFRMTKKMKNTAQSTGRAIKNAPGNVVGGIAGGIKKGQETWEGMKKTGSDVATAYRANRSQTIENAAFKGEGKRSSGALRSAVKTGGAAGMVGAIAGKLAGNEKRVAAWGGVSQYKEDGKTLRSKEDKKADYKTNLKSQLMRDKANWEVKDLDKDKEKLKREQAVADYKSKFAEGNLNYTKDNEETKEKDKDVLKKVQDARTERFATRADIEENNNLANNGFNAGINNFTQDKRNDDGSQIPDTYGPKQVEKADDIMKRVKENRQKTQKVDNFVKGTITDDDKKDKRSKGNNNPPSKPSGGRGRK